MTENAAGKEKTAGAENAAESVTRARLRAEDPEDLAVIAALLQDAETALKEMAYDPETKRFACMLQRFRREDQEDWDACEGMTICQSALVIEGIDEVKYRGIDASDLAAKCRLLTIATEPGSEKLIHIDLVFEAGAEIQLRCDTISARLEDISDPAPAKVTPCDHFKAAMDEAGAQGSGDAG